MHSNVQTRCGEIVASGKEIYQTPGVLITRVLPANARGFREQLKMSEFTELIRKNGPKPPTNAHSSFL